MERSLNGHAILVVEDEPLIAIDIAQAFERAGAHVYTSTTLNHALVLAEIADLSGAVLDHALHDQDSSPLCERLKQRKLPFVVYTGLGTLHGACAAGVQVAKPQRPEVLVTMLGELLGSEPQKSNEPR